jgi:hypothetical protein
MDLFESYSELLAEYHDNKLYKLIKERPTKLCLLLSIIEFRFKGMEIRIKELEDKISEYGII